MPRRPLRYGLLASLTALLVIPVVLAITLGTAALLAAVGDAGAAAACRWVSMGLGIVWAGSVVATAAFSALVSLADSRERPPRRRRKSRWIDRPRDEPRTG